MAAVMAAGVLAGAPAFAANMCKTENMSCATTMPVDGFCQCTSQGPTQDGKVVADQAPAKANATSVGCSANSKDPGCTKP